jgi:hypothetical protein
MFSSVCTVQRPLYAQAFSPKLRPPKLRDKLWGLPDLAANSKDEVFVGSVIKKRRKRMSKKKHRKLLRKTRHQRRNKK